jgi:hypothetical protein
MSIENLRLIFNQATKADLVDGRGSYRRYNKIMRMMGGNHGYSHRIAAAVFCALSPNNDYNGNLRDARNLLKNHRAGRSIEDFKVSTYGNNKRKAWALAGGADPLSLILAPKTRSFYLNVCDPTDPEPVTVDGHIHNCWSGKRMSLVGLRTLGNYDEVAAAVRLLAFENKMVPCEMQGVLWFTWKRIHSILNSGQTTFWHDDMVCAGIGFHLTQEISEVMA